MGKAQRFERRLHDMVGDAFARVFGGSVVPQEVAQALQREADDNVRPLAGGRVLAPNQYIVRLGAADYDRLAGDQQRVVRMLRDCIQSYLTEQAWDVCGEVVVALKRSGTLHTGQFRTSSSANPDTPQPRTAGDRAMSQYQGEYAGDAQRGQYRHEAVPGASPDYGQPPGYDQYGYDQRGYDQSGYDQPGYDQGGYRGQLSALLVVDDGSNRQYQLTEGVTVVGRGQEAQFRLPDTGVSRRHVEITWDGQRALLADLGSTNGTTVNGTPVQTWQLADGDVVRVGQSRLVFRTQA